MSFVWLWTDFMVWLLFGALYLGIRSIRASYQARNQWRDIFQSPIAAVTSLILLTYLLIALADSVHLRISSPEVTNQTHAPSKTEVAQTTEHPLAGRVVSVLDLALSHLILQTERTYSAPFALKEYTSSVQYTEEGEIQQLYLPLKYSGRHLKEGETILGDVIEKSTSVFIASLLILFLIFLMHLSWRLRRVLVNAHLDHSRHLPWKAFYSTLFLILFVLGWLYYLSHFYHVLGTDKVGQDVLYQSVKSIRTGVIIGLLTTLVMLPLALILGISAGYFKGWIDDLIQYLYTTLNSIPGVLLIAAAVLVMQSILAQNQGWFGTTEERADLRLLFLIFILGITSWTGLCRLLRAETLKISQLEYVQSARAFGLGGFAIIRKHILPNLMHLVLIALVLDFSGLVLAEAVLSYVGVGVDPTTPSWGNMINQARLEMAREPMVWWSLFSAFAFMFILVLSANLFSDRVQLVLDPRGKK